MPSVIQLNLLIVLRSFASTSLCICFDRFHTSILSFLFSIGLDGSQKNDENRCFEKNLFPTDFFEQLAIKIKTLIDDEQPNTKSIEQCIQRYLQIVSVCKSSLFQLSHVNMDDLVKLNSLIRHHKLFEILKHKEQDRLRKE